MAKGSGKWFAILVIVLFLASTFSVLLYSNNGEKPADVNKTTVDVTNLMSGSYIATVQGIINQYPMNDYFIMQGMTSEYKTDLLDSQIKDINNVYTVTSSLQIADANLGTYIYTAKVLGSDLTYDYFKQEIIDKNIFGNEYLIYPSAIIDYNSFLTFVNTDLNTTKQYDLGGSQITILMHPEKFDSLVGDKIIFTITATFSGDALTGGYFAEQTDNLSAQPQTIYSLYKGDYDKLGYSVFVLDADQNFSENDFNFINSLGYNFEYFGQNNNAKLDFNSNINMTKLISDINSKLIQDYNAQVDYLINANLFVDKINYLDQNYDINNNIQIISTMSGKSLSGIDYVKYKDAKELQYNISAYLLRGKVVDAFAEVLQDVNS